MRIYSERLIMLVKIYIETINAASKQNMNIYVQLISFNFTKKQHKLLYKIGQDIYTVINCWYFDGMTKFEKK